MAFNRMCDEFDKRYNSHIRTKDHHRLTVNVAKSGSFKKLAKLLLCDKSG